MLDGEELSLPGIDFICFFDCLIIFAYASIPMHHRFLMMECGAHSVNIQIKGRVFFCVLGGTGCSGQKGACVIIFSTVGGAP